MVTVPHLILPHLTLSTIAITQDVQKSEQCDSDLRAQCEKNAASQSSEQCKIGSTRGWSCERDTQGAHENSCVHFPYKPPLRIYEEGGYKARGDYNKFILQKYTPG